MKSSAPLLSPILRSDTQGRMLAELMAEPGEDPNDVDVLVVGTADAGALYEIARQATITTGRDLVGFEGGHDAERDRNTAVMPPAPGLFEADD